MKTNFTLFLLLCFFVAINAQDTKDVTIKNLAQGVVTFADGDLNEYSPISSFNKIAHKQAAKSILLTKDNMAASIAEAKKYKACFITVGVHTIVKVNSFDKSIMSGSWACRMPFGEGYVQKGQLNHKEDYINNIIGIPDTQRRMMFLFE